MKRCDKERIRFDVERISRFNQTPGEGTTRFTYSAEDRGLRELLLCEMKKIGLKARVDAIGNIRARMDGRDNGLPPVMTGSHIDTVKNGGDFDGIAGVVAGLEVLRVMKESKYRPLHPIELVVFVEEEGPNFKFPLAGSRILTGMFPVEKLKDQRNAEGISMYDAAVRCGFKPDEMEGHLLKKGDIKAMVELHIEQSVVLDELLIPVGVVQAAAGRKWLEIEIGGDSNHAGATPMRFRRDPMAGAASIIAQVRNMVVNLANPATVGTVGRIVCYPNEPNVIPEKVAFTVDIRDTDPSGIEIVESNLRHLTEDICGNQGLTHSIRCLSETGPVEFSKPVVEAIETAAMEMGVPHMRMNSGALHDACIMAEITDVGMIFVPSIKGRSHCAEEATRYEDIALGADVLLGALMKLSGL